MPATRITSSPRNLDTVNSPPLSQDLGIREKEFHASVGIWFASVFLGSTG